MPGAITFSRFLPPGIRVRQPFTAPVVLNVLSVSSDGRHPSGGEVWSVNPNTEVLYLNTEGATIEWAVLESQREWALRKVRGLAE